MNFLNADTEIVLDDRRVRETNLEDSFYRLTDEQIEPVYSLGKLGYYLEFVRESETGNQAIMRQGEETASIDHLGNIEHNPKIEIRQ